MPRLGRSYDDNPHSDVSPDRAAWPARHPPEGINGVAADVRAANADVATSGLSRTVHGCLDALSQW